MKTLRTRILIISHDVVGERMAGPGIRYWQLARVLSRSYDVTLAVPGRAPDGDPLFHVFAYDLNDWDSLTGAVQASDVLMPCGFIIRQFPQLVQTGLPIVIDGYDPYMVETLARSQSAPPELAAAALATCQQQLEQECLHGDFFLCASERQRYWWLGMLQVYGRVNKVTFDSDASLANLLATVPFGCSPDSITRTRSVMRGVLPGVGPEDKVVLWGGGIWDWLDPLTLLRAMRRVVDRRPDARLVFPGTRHPNSSVPVMVMHEQAVQLARDLGLLDTHVFFGDWVAYEDWPNYLLEADIGLSLHFDTLETDLAFRSRVLDYIRGGLPMVVTCGDATSEIVARYGLGVIVGYEDVPAVADAILQLLDEPRTARRPGFEAARAELSWENAARPLVEFCRQPRRAADHMNGNEPLRIPAVQSASAQLQSLSEQQLCLQAEANRLRVLVEGYERGRFMRMMRRIQHVRARIGI
jgi:glycosyltransferase involved in cell wall biosynthesis